MKLEKRRHPSLKQYTRALRLPFISVSILPFALGSFINRSNFNLLNFIIGLVIVISAHLASNLFNDYSDSRSGADWVDKKFYNFFGGSKLIQEKVFSEKFYFRQSIIYFLLSFICVVVLASLLKNFLIYAFYFVVIFITANSAEPPYIEDPGPLMISI